MRRVSSARRFSAEGRLPKAFEAHQGLSGVQIRNRVSAGISRFCGNYPPQPLPTVATAIIRGSDVRCHPEAGRWWSRFRSVGYLCCQSLGDLNKSGQTTRQFNSQFRPKIAFHLPWMVGKQAGFQALERGITSGQKEISVGCRGTRSFSWHTPCER